MNPTKTQLRVVRSAERVAAAAGRQESEDRGQRAEDRAEIEGDSRFLTRRELAAVLKVSVRTVDEMVAAKEITPVRPHGVMVRFYLPDVVRELTAKAVLRTDPLAREVRSSKAEVRRQMEGGKR